MNIPEIAKCPRCHKPLWGIFGPAEGGPVDGLYWAECSGECPDFYYGTTRAECEAEWNRRQPTPEAADAWIKHGGIPACTTDPLVKMAWESDGYKVIPVYAHPPKPEPTEEPMGSSVCPICQKDTPHYHAPEVVEAHYSDAVKSASLNQNTPKPPAEWMAEAVAKKICDYLEREVGHDTDETDRAMIAGYISQHYSAPAGYQMVPVEPTDEQLLLMFRAFHTDKPEVLESVLDMSDLSDVQTRHLRAGYVAALAAAPKTVA